MIKSGIESILYYAKSIDLKYYLFSLVLGSGCFIALRSYHVNLKARIASSLMISYLFLIFVLTVLSRNRYIVDNTIFSPFWSYIEILHGSSHSYALVVEIVLNILLFVPVGFLLPFLLRKHIVTCGFLCSMFIELCQFITKTGYFEVKDLIHNTIGVIIGVAIYKFGVRIITKLR